MVQPTNGLAEAFELFEVGMRFVEQRFRRDHPHATDDEVGDRLREWMLDRALAPDGDCTGLSRIDPSSE